MLRAARIVRIMKIIDMMDAVIALPKESEHRANLEGYASRSAMQSNNLGMLYARCERNDAVLMDLVVMASVLCEHHYSFFKRRVNKLYANG